MCLCNVEATPKCDASVNHKRLSFVLWKHLGRSIWTQGFCLIFIRVGFRRVVWTQIEMAKGVSSVQNISKSFLEAIRERSRCPDLGCPTDGSIVCDGIRCHLLLCHHGKHRQCQWPLFRLLQNANDLGRPIVPFCLKILRLSQECNWKYWKATLHQMYPSTLPYIGLNKLSPSTELKCTTSGVHCSSNMRSNNCKAFGQSWPFSHALVAALKQTSFFATLVT